MAKREALTGSAVKGLVNLAVCAVAAHFGASGNDVLVGDSFKSSCAVGQSAVLDGTVGGTAGGVAMTSFYDTTPASSSCDMTQSNGVTSSFGFTQEQVACVCEVRRVISLSG